jgi:hypothetical protein
VAADWLDMIIDVLPTSGELGSLHELILNKRANKETGLACGEYYLLHITKTSEWFSAMDTDVWLL